MMYVESLIMENLFEYLWCPPLCRRAKHHNAAN